MTLRQLTADIVSAHVGNNELATPELPRLIQDVYRTLQDIAGEASTAALLGMPVMRSTAVAATPAETPDTLTCLECGIKGFKVLKQHIKTHGMTPDQYRRKHGLAATAPMVTANYSKRRSDLAKASGLGTPANRNRRKSS